MYVQAYNESGTKDKGSLRPAYNFSFEAGFSHLLHCRYKPGETGLLALDWWNGNRSLLVDTNLTGLIVGYTLLTKPEEVYRTLLEATAFGTRKNYRCVPS